MCKQYGLEKWIRSNVRTDDPVDVGAHDYSLETLQASGVRPASIEVRSAPATGLKRFGSAATAADETASLVSTAFAVGLAAALGLSGKNKKGPKPGSSKSKSNNAATAKKSNIVKKTSKPFNRKTTGTAYVPSYRGYTASSSSSSRGGSGASRDSGSGPAPAMQAAAALASMAPDKAAAVCACVCRRRRPFSLPVMPHQSAELPALAPRFSLGEGRLGPGRPWLPLALWAVVCAWSLWGGGKFRGMA